MTEKNNVFQKLIEKPKQAITNLATMVKARISEAEEKARLQREIYLTTPPKEGDSTIRFEDSNNGIYCSSGALRRNEFTWSPQEKRWLLTNSEIVVISGGRF